MEDRIESSITIDAPLDRVWELVSEPGWWVPTALNERVDHTPGHQTVRESEKWGRFPVEVVRVEPKSYVAFRWASQFPGQDLAPGRTTFVEFRVDPLADGVRVTVVESGFAALDAPDDVRRDGRQQNTEGWKQELAKLRDRAEQAV